MGEYTTTYDKYLGWGGGTKPESDQAFGSNY